MSAARDTPLIDDEQTTTADGEGVSDSMTDTHRAGALSESLSGCDRIAVLMGCEREAHMVSRVYLPTFVDG